MSKKTPRSKCLDAAQKLARLSEADDNGYCTCVSCGGIFYWTDGDGGHFIAKGHSSYWALREENIHFQCKGCNGFGMKYGTAANQYTLWMVDKYGREFVNSLELLKRTQIKYYKKDYEEMTKAWNEEIKTHLKRIGQ